MKMGCPSISPFLLTEYFQLPKRRLCSVIANPMDLAAPASRDSPRDKNLLTSEETSGPGWE